jgi:hypothetical protein
MDERGWLQCVALALFPEIAGGKSTKFLVHEGREVIEGLLVTPRPFRQQSGYFVGSRKAHFVDSGGVCACYALYTPTPKASLKFNLHPFAKKTLFA